MTTRQRDSLRQAMTAAGFRLLDPASTDAQRNEHRKAIAEHIKESAKALMQAEKHACLAGDETLARNLADVRHLIQGMG